MSTLPSQLRAELSALTFPLRRRTRHRLQAYANDALAWSGRERRFDETLAEQWQRILARSPALLDSLPAADAPRVLFGSMFGASFATRPIEAVLAMAVRLRGAHAVVLRCDEGLPACEWNVFGNHQPAPGPFAPEGFHHAKLLDCKACSLKLSESHDLPGIEQLSLTDFAEAGDVQRAQALTESVSLQELREFTYRDLAVGEHAHASLLKATLRGVPIDDERTRFLARRLLTAAILLVERGERVFDRIRPDHFVTADGIYVTSAPLCALARKRGVHVVVHGTPYRKQTVWLSHHESYHRALINEKNRRWEELDMTPERTHIAEEYLASKHFTARDYTSFHVDSIQDQDAIRQELGLDARPIVSLYTNILWDAQLYYRLNVFSNMLDWLFETVRFFASHPELQLAIRLHPGEAPGGWPTNQPILPELERAFPVLPENVKVVRPESKVSSYSLGKMSVAALVYGARVGVELAMLGTPVIVAGEAFMRGKGFTLDPTSQDEYRAMLARARDLPHVSEEARTRAKKWYYYYFFRLMVPFPFYDVKGKSPARLTFESLNDLMPGRSESLDLLCRGILDEKLPFEWDGL